MSELRTSARAMNVAVKFSRVRSGLNVTGDFGRLVTIFTLILANALHRSNPGGVVTITLKRAGNGFAQVTCHDEGPTPASEDITLAFQPLAVRGDIFVAHPRSFGGGFSLVKCVVEQHAGTLALELLSPKGIAVSIWLPCQTDSTAAH